MGTHTVITKIDTEEFGQVIVRAMYTPEYGDLQWEVEPSYLDFLMMDDMNFILAVYENIRQQVKGKL